MKTVKRQSREVFMSKAHYNEQTLNNYREVSISPCYRE